MAQGGRLLGSRSNSWGQLDLGPTLSEGNGFVYRFGFDSISPQHGHFIAKLSDSLILFFESLSLKDWMSLGFGQVELAVVGNLMKGARSTWLDSITLTPP